MMLRARAFVAVGLVAGLSACAKDGDLVIDQGVGITSVLSLCPAAGIPDYTGDVTTFRTTDTTVASLDVSAAMTDLRTTCNDTGEQVYSESSFTVNARRSDTRGARTVELPYFVTVLRGGSAVVSKRIGTVTLVFADGQERTSAAAKAASFINRADAALPDDIREKITKRRRAGDAEAALDPLADPEVKAAIARTRFEMLVGFQLTEAQLAYNVTR
ncbi:hypothetical protein C0V72_02575 [Porphyrobacter sp. TH134]|uniref:hypothetical protein n=1 Tax=Porphyrobacter sp. TH134 TaxID=2067450 RepID=UPI000C7B17CF|nr:hypothetical protein [Porphyrobacter sp. TH134]PLK25196.1 hypothetical protein C0V72_02575 [Porphyrobacter sp. TH134]